MDEISRKTIDEWREAARAMMLKGLRPEDALVEMKSIIARDIGTLDEGSADVAQPIKRYASQ